LPCSFRKKGKKQYPGPRTGTCTYKIKVLRKKSHISGNPEVTKLVSDAITVVLLRNIISCCGVTEYCSCVHEEETGNTPKIEDGEAGYKWKTSITKIK
jgi:hypothetical protein